MSLINNVIVLHVTEHLFNLLASGQKLHEYRPRTRYYMQRIEKYRDWIAAVAPLDPKVFVDFRKAYRKFDDPGTWFFAKVKRISLVTFSELPDDVHAFYKKLRSDLMVDDWFYDIELEG